MSKTQKEHFYYREHCKHITKQLPDRLSRIHQQLSDLITQCANYATRRGSTTSRSRSGSRRSSARASDE